MIIAGKVFLYNQKAPFVVSGHSVKGALEFDDASDSVKCHECGQWFRSVGSHLSAHGLSAREYKLKHGLTLGSALISEGYRSAQISINRRLGSDERLALQTSARGKEMIARRSTWKRGVDVVNRNLRGTCPAQILETIKSFAAENGRPPRYRDLNDQGIYGQSAARALGVTSWAEVVRLAGLIPHETRDGYYGKPLLLELLRIFCRKSGRLPSNSDYRRRLLPHHSTYIRAFGSLGAAYFAAGVDGLISRRARKQLLNWEQRRSVCRS